MQKSLKLLIEKLFILVNGKTSQGVKDYLNVDVIAKGTKFTMKQLAGDNYETLIRINGLQIRIRMNLSSKLA